MTDKKKLSTYRCKMNTFVGPQSAQNLKISRCYENDKKKNVEPNAQQTI